MKKKLEPLLLLYSFSYYCEGELSQDPRETDDLGGWYGPLAHHHRRRYSLQHPE